VAILYAVPIAVEATHDQMKMLQALEKDGGGLSSSEGPTEIDYHQY